MYSSLCGISRTRSEDEVILTIDSPQPILNLLRTAKLCIDPRFRGELTLHYENPGIRACYFSRNGATIDEFGELLLDRGYVTERPSERDVLELLDTMFRTFTRIRTSARSTETEANVNGRDADAELRKAMSNRQRAWNCQCGASLIRSARLALALTCEHCGGRLFRLERTPAEILADVPLSVVQQPDYSPIVSNTPF